MKSISQILRYGGVTIASHVFLLAATATLVEAFAVEPPEAYIAALAATYLGVYVSSSRFVFRVKPTIGNAVGFIAILIVFMTLNMVFFMIFYAMLSMPYFAAMLLNVMLLGPVRYFANKQIFAR